MTSGIDSWLNSGNEGKTTPIDDRLPICSISVFCRPTVAFRCCEYRVPAPMPIRMAQFRSGANCCATTQVRRVIIPIWIA
jgi:hypothetical protein